MITLAHLSDLHFGRERPAVVTGLHQALAELGPDYILISGDLTQRATHRQFQRARQFLDHLQQPYLVVPGNHDLSAHRLVERFCAPWRKWARYIGPELEPLVRTEKMVAVGVNTARRSGFYLDWSRGRINLKQVQRLTRCFVDTPEQRLRVVVAHHPFWLPDAFLSRCLIGGRDAALDALARAGVDLIVGGHVHRDYLNILQGVVISHAGTSVSDRLERGRPNSFNMIRGDRHRLEVEKLVWCGSAFQPSERRCFVRKTQGWEYT